MSANNFKKLQFQLNQNVSFISNKKILHRVHAINFYSKGIKFSPCTSKYHIIINKCLLDAIKKIQCFHLFEKMRSFFSMHTLIYSTLKLASIQISSIIWT